MSALTATRCYKADSSCLRLTRAGPEPQAPHRESTAGLWFYSLRPRLVATCCSTSICLMASLRVKWTTSTQ